MKEKVSKKKVVEVAPMPIPTSPLQQVDFYTLEYIEKCWGITVRHMQTQIKLEKLKAKVIANRYLVLHSELLNFINAQPNGVFVKTRTVQ